MKPIYSENENGFVTNTICATSALANPEIANKIIALPVGDDLRSEWYWFRLASGDLILGCYPHGDTYFMSEADPNRP
jgi:hypothetical protein